MECRLSFMLQLLGSTSAICAAGFGIVPQDQLRRYKRTSSCLNNASNRLVNCCCGDIAIKSEFTDSNRFCVVQVWRQLVKKKLE